MSTEKTLSDVRLSPEAEQHLSHALSVTTSARADCVCVVCGKILLCKIPYPGLPFERFCFKMMVDHKEWSIRQ